MKTRYPAILTLGLLLTVGGQGGLWAQTTKQDDIKRLLDIIGARGMGRRVFTQVVEGFKRANQDIPDAVWKEMYSESETSIDGFVTERLVPIYDRYLTHDDIKGLVAFYESSLGKKLLRVMPQMSQESMMAGRAWGLEFAEAVKKRLAEKGDSK